jgi:hypothetical protein
LSDDESGGNSADVALQKEARSMGKDDAVLVASLLQDLRAPPHTAS